MGKNKPQHEQDDEPQAGNGVEIDADEVNVDAITRPAHSSSSSDWDPSQDD